MKKFLGLMMIVAILILSIPAFAESVGKTAYSETITMTSANTEYDWTIPNGISAVTIQCRGPYDVKLSFTDGLSGTTYFTLKSGDTYFETNISTFGNSLHVQCATAAQVVEIIYWM